MYVYNSACVIVKKMHAGWNQSYLSVRENIDQRFIIYMYLHIIKLNMNQPTMKYEIHTDWLSSVTTSLWVILGNPG